MQQTEYTIKFLRQYVIIGLTNLMYSPSFGMGERLLPGCFIATEGCG